MNRVIEQTYDEKYDMYMKLSKKKLAEMLIQCNSLLNKLATPVPITNKSVITFSVDPEMATLGRAY